MKRLIAMAAALVVSITACVAAYDPYYYSYAYYDPYWYAYDAYYAYSWVDPYGTYYYSAPKGALEAQQQIDVNAAAQGIANSANTYYTPAGCAQATASGATVSYTFNQCDGAFGLREVSGAVTLNLSESNGQLAMAATSSDLTVRGEPFILDMNLTATSAGTQRVVTMQSRSRNPDQVDSRNATITLNWEQGVGCVNMAGQGGSTKDDLTTTSTVTGFQRCGDQCPITGTVTVETEKGVFKAEFDGSSTLKVVGPDGEVESYDLRCGE